MNNSNNQVIGRVPVPTRVQFLKWARYIRLTILKRVIRVIWDHLRSCSCSAPYRRLTVDVSELIPATSATASTNLEAQRSCTNLEAVDFSDDDLVSLKVSLLGDNHIGKTSFMNKYVGDEEENRGMQMTGLNLMNKILSVKDAKIAFNLWDVGGDSDCLTHVPIACKDAVAILFMFDLTSRCTLTNVIDWYYRARKWNKKAIPILIGTKFDDFARLPLEMQCAIINEARAYARAMKATLFFSSSTQNINVNKIFKFIMAKCFDLPWQIERNLTVGEPIIDF